MASTVIVVCPHCKHKTRASAEHIGRKGKCPNPKCQKLMDIIPSGQETTQSLVPLRDRTGARPTAGSGIRAPVWLAAVIAVGITVLLYALMFYPLQERY